MDTYIPRHIKNVDTTELEEKINRYKAKQKDTSYIANKLTNDIDHLINKTEFTYCFDENFTAEMAMIADMKRRNIPIKDQQIILAVVNAIVKKRSDYLDQKGG